MKKASSGGRGPGIPDWNSQKHFGWQGLGAILARAPRAVFCGVAGPALPGMENEA